MKTIKLLGLSLLLLTIFSCGNKDNGENSEQGDYVALDKMDIARLEQEIKVRTEAVENDTIGDKNLAADLLEAYVVYGENFPNRVNSAEYIFKAGEIAMNLNHTAQAIKLFTQVFDEYKDYEKRPYALFMKAFVLENQAKNYPEAQFYYNDFIKKFPDHPMADDAAYSLKNIGKSPEQLIREFEIQDSLRALNEAV